MIYIYIGALLAAFFAGFGLESRRWHNADVERERASLEAALKTETQNAKVEVQYVDRVVEIQSKPVVAIKRVLVDRVCPGGSAGVPGQSAVDAGSAPAAADTLAGELRDCVANAEQLYALQAQVRPQLPKP